MYPAGKLFFSLWNLHMWGIPLISWIPREGQIGRYLFFHRKLVVFVTGRYDYANIAASIFNAVPIQWICRPWKYNNCFMGFGNSEFPAWLPSVIAYYDFNQWFNIVFQYFWRKRGEYRNVVLLLLVLPF